MNANEQIELLKNKQIYGTNISGDKIAWYITASIAERDSIIRELSRTRIRVTSEEKPTREDAEPDYNKVLCVLAYIDSLRDWYSTEVTEVARYPDKYSKWTCLPKLPKVTP